MTTYTKNQLNSFNFDGLRHINENFQIKMKVNMWNENFIVKFMNTKTQFHLINLL